MNDLDQAQVGQVAVQRCSGTSAAFLNRMDGEHKRHTSSFPNSLFGTFDGLQMNAITRSNVAACLGDSDDRLAGLDFFVRHSVVQVPFNINCRHARVIGDIEPLLAAEPIGSLRFFCAHLSAFEEMSLYDD